MGNGSGYGDLMDRDPNLVLSDIREGYITEDSAESTYGVALDEEGNVDIEMTEHLR